MPYRIQMTWEMPDYEDNPVEGVIKAVRSKEDAEEAIGKHDGEFLYEDVEWYGFSEENELVRLGWTWADEEILQQLNAAAKEDWTSYEVVGFIESESEDEAQKVRVHNEWKRRERQPKPKRKPDVRAAGEALAQWIADHATDPSVGPVKQLLANWDRANDA